MNRESNLDVCEGYPNQLGFVSCREKGILNRPFPPCPLDGPVLEEGVRPDRRVQSNLSDLDCCQLHMLFSKSHDGSEKRYIEIHDGFKHNSF